MAHHLQVIAVVAGQAHNSLSPVLTHTSAPLLQSIGPSPRGVTGGLSLTFPHHHHGHACNGGCLKILESPCTHRLTGGSDFPVASSPPGYFTGISNAFWFIAHLLPVLELGTSAIVTKSWRALQGAFSGIPPPLPPLGTATEAYI
jgi:hypothetical protein